MLRKLFLPALIFLALGSAFLSGCQPPDVRTVPPGVGELNLFNIDPITLDPAVSGDMTSHEYIVQIFNSLVRLDSKLEVVPDIAERWQVSADGRTYTFSLRQDVFFHDGRQVKADDFKYSWERACAPATGSHTAPLYLGDIVGARDVLEGKAKEISGVSVADDFTLKVTIDAPKVYFLAKLTYPTAFVVDKKNVASGKGWWHKPNGTGPFKLQKWEENNLIVLERNERYYGEVPRINRVNFKLWSGVPMVMYETGDIDVTDVYMNYIDLVSDKSGKFYPQLQIVPELSFSYLGFNHTKPPFDDVNIRRAFSMAVDRDKIISVLQRDMVERADGILPPGMPGFNQNLVGLGYDPQKAKQLIAASRYGGAGALPPITVTTSGYGGQISGELEALVQQWRENLGVEVAVRQLEPERFLYYLKEEKDEMFLMGWVADYPHPQDFLDILFHSGTDSNYGEYRNAEADALLEKAAVTQNEEESLKLYQQAEQLMVDDAACIPLWFGKNYLLVKPYVQGYNLNPMGYAMLNEVSIKRD